MMRSKGFRALAAAGVALLMVVGGASAAVADQLTFDGDGVAPFGESAASVQACTDKPVQFNILLAALRQGEAAKQNFLPGSKVTVTVDSAGAGMTVALPDNVIDVPGDWDKVKNNPPTPGTDLITATVTLPAQAAGGSSSISFGFSGTTAENKPMDPSNANRSSVSVTWTTKKCITDSTAPILTLPGAITTEATGPAGAVVTFAATATDETAPSTPAVTCSALSGSTFAIGTTAVSCFATDAAGNTRTGSFTVVVQDTTKPVVGSLSSVGYEATGAGTVVTWTNPTAIDTVSGSNLSVTCAPASEFSFPVGPTTVTCSATDAAGNVGSSTFTVTISDTTVPNLTLPANVVEEAKAAVGNAVTFTASAQDLVSGGVAVTCLPASGSTFEITTTTVDCSASDAQGNKATGSFTVTIRDTIAPVITVPAPAAVEATSAQGAVVTYDSATATDIVDGAVTPDCKPAAGATFPVGTTIVTCAANDAAGNSSSKTFPVTVVDTTAPVLSVPNLVVVEATSSEGATVEYTVTAVDVVDGTDVTVTCTPASGSTFVLYDTKVDCTAKDKRGNTSKIASFGVFVQDTTKPVVTAPDDMTVEATGAYGAAVTYPTIIASDAVDDALDISCLPVSGSTFALDTTTTVTCVAIDDSENEGADSFTVTVRDTTSPEITVPKDVTKEATGPHGATVSYDTATATDAVDAEVGVTCTPESGTNFGLGVTTVTCTATDDSKNVKTGTFTVTVRDTTAPELHVPADVTVEATKPEGADVSYNAATATDVVDPDVNVVCVPAVGATFALGTTTVTCTATDFSTNTTTDIFTVTVLDRTKPVISVPSDIVAEATGPAGRTVEFEAAQAWDAVDQSVPVTCSAASGDTFPLGTTTVTCSGTDDSDNTGSSAFTVTIEDTTAPDVTAPTDVTKEATGPDGATVDYDPATAKDLVDTKPTVGCAPASGVKFPLGSTKVTCIATDFSNNSGSNFFTVTVRDTTAPKLEVSADLTPEATGPNGAKVDYEAAAASDIVDPNVSVSCSPASGEIYPLGPTTVTCTAIDFSKNVTTDSFIVAVLDRTKPVISTPGDLTKEATSAAGAPVTYGPASASDAVDEEIPVTCSPASGGTFPLGTTTVTCTGTDDSGNTGTKSFTVTVQDTTAPEITVSDNLDAEATSGTGAPVTYEAATGNDLVDGEVAVTCAPESGHTFPLGTTTVTCTGTDKTGNKGTGSFTVTVEDTTPPVIEWTGGPVNGAHYVFGATIPTPTCKATDVVKGDVRCEVDGFSTAVGAHHLTATATDGTNVATTPAKAYMYTVDAWTKNGFFQPVDMGTELKSVLNTVKAGSTVPLKFELFAGGTELTNTSAVKSFTYKSITCATSATVDEIETVVSGQTVLRYDTTGGQFIQNWQTPKSPVGACYRVTMTAQDGTTITADFKLK